MEQFRSIRQCILAVVLVLCTGMGRTQSTAELLDQARKLKFTKPDSAIILAKQAAILLRTKPNPHHQVSVYNIIGLANWALGNTTEAEKYIQKALAKAITIKDDTLQTMLHNNLGILKRGQIGLREALGYHLRALASAKRSKRLFDIADTYNNIAGTYMYFNNNDSGVYYLERALMVYQNKMNSDKNAEIGYGDCATNIGLAYFDEGKYSIAYTYFFKALTIFEKYKLYDKANVAANNIAEIYQDKGDFGNAMKFSNLSLEYEKKQPNEMQRGFSLFVLGKIYHDQNKFDSALVAYEGAKEIFEKFEMESHLYALLNSMAIAYKRTGNFDKGILSLNKSLEGHIKMQDTAGICSNYSNYAKIYYEMAEYSTAETYIFKALKVMRPHLHFSLYTNMLQQASEIESKLGKHKEAYDYLTQHKIYHDSLIKQARDRTTAEMAQIYQSEKKEKELILAKTENEKNSLELRHEREEGKRKSLQLYMALSGALLLIVLGVFVVRSNVIRKKTNKLLAEKNSIIYEQKAMVEEKNQEITDSINYALRIQRAVLPGDNLMKSALGNHFVCFMPKDIVSGDFYWAYQLPQQKALLACGDSTGHGVPGAIMSVLNISALENAVETLKEFTPAQVLDFTRKKIIEKLASEGTDEGGKDGMDCILLLIDRPQLKLQFAMANNNLWILRNKELLEFNADKMPVGKHDRDKMPFTHHEVSILKGDLIIAITDGFPDQFGGEKGKKFKYANLKNLLIQNADKDLPDLKNALITEFEQWKGDMEQVDDVCIIGVRV